MTSGSLSFTFLKKSTKKVRVAQTRGTARTRQVAVEGTFGTLVEEGRMFLVNYLLL